MGAIARDPATLFSDEPLHGGSPSISFCHTADDVIWKLNPKLPEGSFECIEVLCWWLMSLGRVGASPGVGCMLSNIEVGKEAGGRQRGGWVGLE